MIQRYREQIVWRTGAQRGANHARNWGMALARGQYLQFLDTDDYLLPEKIEPQVRHLEQTGADIVYGDWHYQRHLPNGSILIAG
jgi:glycosyltransferase involved in cell wall biosynthesis